nr:DAK2 domain-containing protein [Shouchella shacheensis]
MIKKLNGHKLGELFIEGAMELSKQAEVVDALNVFPVPDGDTGTNMNLTMTSGVKEVKKGSSEQASAVASTFAKGLLMGARGNSGVILSQLFRGFSKAVEGKKELTTEQFAEALESGVQTAYKAVMKPVEGTILTVAKDAAKHAVKASKKEEDFARFIKTVIKEAEKSLKRTPELLPVLKEVGVVDSGGQGLVYIYDGFLMALTGEKSQRAAQPDMKDLINIEHHHNAQSHTMTSDIEFGYCTEVMVKFDENKLAQKTYDEQAFRAKLSEYGDSLLVVSDEDLVKVHIHAEYPGNVLTEAQTYGNLLQVKIENMREQHSNLLREENGPHQSTAPSQKEKTDFAIVTVSMGEGIEKLFKGLGASVVISGGQTMNPSTEDIVAAIEEAHAENVLVLPNNGNIVLAAEQAASVADNKVSVVPTKTVPQGLAALLAFNPTKNLAENAEHMKEAMGEVRTGEVTYAVRDTQMDGKTIEKGDFMGISEKNIVSTGRERTAVAKELLASMIDEQSEMVTLIAGEDSEEAETKAIIDYVEKTFTDVEIDTVEGGQPLYSYIFSVE